MEEKEVVIYIENEEKELTLDPNDHFEGKNDLYGFECLYEKESYKSNSAYIEIDYLITILEKIKEKNKKYIAIDFHEDHQEYELYSADFNILNEETLNEKKKSEKLKLIEDLKKSREREQHNLKLLEQRIKNLEDEQIK